MDQCILEFRVVLALGKKLFVSLFVLAHNAPVTPARWQQVEQVRARV